MNKLKINETEWNLTPLFKNDNDSSIKQKRIEWESETNKFVKKWKNDNSYLSNPKKLKEALDDYEKWAANYGTEADEAYYFWLRTNQDQISPELKAKFNKVEELSKKLGNEIQFFALNLSKIPKKEQDIFLSSSELKIYKHFLERLFEKSKFLLSEKEEKILNLKETSSYSLWVKMTSEFLAKEEREILDEDEKKVKKSFSDILSLTQSTNKKTRDSAAKEFNDILSKHADSAEAEMNAILADKKVNDELRGFSRPDQSRHLSDDIDTEIVDSLIQAVSNNFEISKKFYELKAKLFKVKKLQYHERNVPYGKITEKYDLEKSANLIHKVFSNLDPKFSELLESFIKNGQIDAFPRKGKEDGAMCVHFLKTQPTYIMLNHTSQLRDVTTFAHELGHAINNELIKEKQHAIYFDTPLSTAEVASTFMEDFVLEEIMKESDEEQKLSIMTQKLTEDISTIIRQIACYKFEQELHKTFREKGHISKEGIGKIFQKHMSSYMGESVEQSKGSENWWVYWGHIRRYFYNYSYASGLLISKAMQNLVKENPSNIQKVKEFLSAGLSDSPKNIFKKMNIDITDKEFWNKGLNEMNILLKETENLAKKLNKI